MQNIFLVGGFGESKYLKEEILWSMERVRRVNVRLSDNPWTAVVRGAVVVGIEKDRNTSLTTIKPLQKNYGLLLAKAYSVVEDDKRDLEYDPVTKIPMAVKRFQWLFKTGDAILSNRPRQEHQTFVVRFTEFKGKSGEIPIYTYPHEDIPERFENDPELVPVHILSYNLAGFPLQDFEHQRDAKTKTTYYHAALEIKFTLQKNLRDAEGGALKMALYWKNHKLDEGEIFV